MFDDQSITFPTVNSTQLTMPQESNPALQAVNPCTLKSHTDQQVQSNETITVKNTQQKCNHDEIPSSENSDTQLKSVVNASVCQQTQNTTPRGRSRASRAVSRSEKRSSSAIPYRRQSLSTTRKKDVHLPNAINSSPQTTQVLTGQPHYNDTSTGFFQTGEKVGH
jgi:hypothetical protein